jgi:hypothetical protein
MYLRLLFCILIVSVFTCTSERIIGPASGSCIISRTYILNVSDTTNLLKNLGDSYHLYIPKDSSQVSTDTIWYNDPGKEVLKVPYLAKSNLVKTTSHNPELKEFYLQNQTGLHLVGYSTSDSLRPYEVFERPLLIIPNSDVEKISSSSKRHIWHSQSQSFQQEITTRTQIEQKGIGKLIWNSEVEDFIKYELTISTDRILEYGKSNLVMPDAIMLKSVLILNTQGYLICEWGIRSRSGSDESDQSINATYPNNETFLEFTLYEKVY